MHTIAEFFSWLWSSAGATPWFWAWFVNAVIVWILVLLIVFGIVDGNDDDDVASALSATILAFVAPLILWGMATGFKSWPVSFGAAYVAPPVAAIGLIVVAAAAYGTFRLSKWAFPKITSGWRRCWNWITSKLRRHHQHALEAKAAERKASGADTQAEFDELARKVREAIGNGQMSALGETVMRLVGHDVPRLLAQHRLILDLLPTARAAMKDVEDAPGARMLAADDPLAHERDESRTAVEQLERRLTDIDTLLKRMKLSLELKIPMIANARAGLHDEKALAQTTLDEIADFTQAIARSVDDVAALPSDPVAAADAEMARLGLLPAKTSAATTGTPPGPLSERGGGGGPSEPAPARGGTHA